MTKETLIARRDECVRQHGEALQTFETARSLVFRLAGAAEVLNILIAEIDAKLAVDEPVV